MNSEKVNAYLQSDGVRCPYCGDARIIGSPVVSRDDTTKTQRIVCDGCREVWQDIYVLTDVEGDRD